MLSDPVKVVPAGLSVHVAVELTVSSEREYTLQVRFVSVVPAGGATVIVTEKLAGAYSGTFEVTTTGALGAVEPLAAAPL
jgi:hypothetical protein